MSDGPGSLVGRSIGEVGDRSGSVPSKENVKKLDQIIQVDSRSWQLVGFVGSGANT